MRETFIVQKRGRLMSGEEYFSQINEVAYDEGMETQRLYLVPEVLVELETMLMISPESGIVLLCGD
jgi:hypothetical protein